ncbi:MAG: FadR/GntR family transcriptional regulator [Solirubrobacterales bacterium]
MSRYEEVAKQIRTQIADGKIAPGERLPVESALAASFGVSRSTIREALRVLGSEGLIRTTRGVSGGSFVLESGTEAVGEHLERRLAMLSRREAFSAGELQETRQLLESSAAGLAAERRSAQHLDELREALEQEQQFHAVLLAAAQNRLLELITAPVLRLAGERLLAAGSGPEPRVDGDHERILERIEAGDAEGAASATVEHLGRLAGA